MKESVFLESARENVILTYTMCIYPITKKRFYLIEVYLNVWNINKLNSLWKHWTIMKYEKHWLSLLLFFPELVFLWLSASQSVVHQRVKIYRVLGVKGYRGINSTWGFCGTNQRCFSKPSLAKTELATTVAFGKRTPDQNTPSPTDN